MDELRKVIYSFVPAPSFDPDKSMQKENEELARKRNGNFHGTTEELVDEQKKLYFVIEDEETGKVNNIEPTLVEFVR